MYKTIVNPETGRKVKVNGKIGKKVLNSYKKQFQLGGNGDGDNTWFWQQQIEKMLVRTLEKITDMIEKREFLQRHGETDELTTYFKSIQNALRDSEKKEIIKKLIYTITQSQGLRWEFKPKLFIFPYDVPLELNHIKNWLDDKAGDDLDVLLFVLECWTHLNYVAGLPKDSDLFDRYLKNEQKPTVPDHLRNGQYTTELIEQVKKVFNNLRDYRLNKNYETHGNDCVVGEIPINGTFDKSCCMITKINSVAIEDIDDETFNKLNDETAFDVLEGQKGKLAYHYLKNTFEHGKMFRKTFTSNKNRKTYSHIRGLNHKPTHNACIPYGLRSKRDEKKRRLEELRRPKGMRRRMSAQLKKSASNVGSKIGSKIGRTKSPTYGLYGKSPTVRNWEEKNTPWGKKRSETAIIPL